MAVVSDVVEGRAERTAAGWRLERWFLVDGLSGSTALYDAATASGVPAYGDAHPSVAGLVAVHIDASPAAGKQPSHAMVRVDYASPDEAAEAAQAAVGTVISKGLDYTISTEQVYEDKNSTLMAINRTVTSGNITTLSATLKPADIERPMLRAWFERIEASSGATALAVIYNGKVNVSSWQGYPARTWLCAGPSLDEIEGSANRLGRWEFFYRPETWQHATFDNSFSGHATGDEVPWVWHVYQEADFNGLSGMVLL